MNEPFPPSGEHEPDHLRRLRLQPWFGRPSGTLPGIVPLERVLAQSESAAVCVSYLAVYPHGFEVYVITITANEDTEFGLPFLGLGQPRPKDAVAGEGMSPEMMALAFYFSDGTKATNADVLRTPQGYWEGTEPDGPVIHFVDGSGGEGRCEHRYWLWPLPPPGPVVFECEWPEAAIEKARFAIDAQVVRDAAIRAKVLFSRG